MRDYRAFMKRYRPDGDPTDLENAYAYTSAQLMVHILEQCGDDLTRENLMRQALGIKDLELPLLLPGIRINTSQTRRAPIDQFQIARFDGQHWTAVGGSRRRVIGGCLPGPGQTADKSHPARVGAISSRVGK